MLNWPINKTKNNITKTLCSSPYLCCCFTADLKTWLAKFINRNRKRQTAKRARTAVFLVCFLQKAKANNKSVTLTLASPAFMTMPTKIPWTAMRCFSLILHCWRLRFLSQWASACVPRSEKSFPAKLSNETTFKMDSILIYTRLLINQKAPC